MSDNIISFRDAHDSKHGPDPEFVCRNDMGVKWFKFACTYEHEGQEWCLDIWARDFDDAAARLKAIGGGRVDGQIYREVQP